MPFLAFSLLHFGLEQLGDDLLFSLLKVESLLGEGGLGVAHFGEVALGPLRRVVVLHVPAEDGRLFGVGF